MSSDATSRPPRVLTACLIAGLGAALILLEVFAKLWNWGSLENREQVQRVLGDRAFRGYGFEVDQVLEWYRLILMAVAAVAVSTIVLAVFAARRHRGARIGLTVLTVLASVVFVVTGPSGFLLSAMFLVCVYYLWSPDSRAWFAGESPARRPNDPFARPTPPPPPDGPAARSPQTPYGSSVATQQRVALPVPSGRPPSVVRAIAITVAMSAIVALICGSYAISYAASPDDEIRQVADNPFVTSGDVLRTAGMTPTQLARVTFVISIVLTVMALLAIGVALLVLRRVHVARVALTVLTGLGIAFAIVSVLGLVWVPGCVYVLVLLYRPDVNEWFRRTPGAGPTG